MKPVSERNAHVGLAQRVGRGVVVFLSWLILGVITLYQRIFSPVLHALGGAGSGCRYTPSCSQFAAEAVIRHGPFAGGWMAMKRVARCHPWGGCGHDPVPATTALPHRSS